MLLLNAIYSWHNELIKRKSVAICDKQIFAPTFHQQYLGQIFQIWYDSEDIQKVTWSKK